MLANIAFLNNNCKASEACQMQSLQIPLFSWEKITVLFKVKFALEAEVLWVKVVVYVSVSMSQYFSGSFVGQS